MAHVGQRCRLCDGASALIPSVSQLCADKGYDTDAFRAFLKANSQGGHSHGSNRKKPIRHDKQAYNGRNVVTLRQARQKFRLGPMRRRNAGLLALT
jgi:transposase